jgi:signal recognition particle receptor subunit beta
MGEKQEIRVRIALVGPPGSGKTAALECLHRTTPADRRGPLIQIASSTGRTLLYDHAEFSFGNVGELPLYVDIYALPGAPASVLARRSILSGCDAFVFTADGRDTALQQTRAGFQELLDFLAEQGRTPEETALIVQLTRQDLIESDGGRAVTAALQKAVGPERVVLVSTKNGDGVEEALKKTMALALALERDEIEATATCSSAASCWKWAR